MIIQCMIMAGIDLYQEMVMSTKETRIAWLWLQALVACIPRSGGGVSAGCVAREMGQSRNTAKKYLDMLVADGQVVSARYKWHTGMDVVMYAPCPTVRSS